MFADPPNLFVDHFFVGDDLVVGDGLFGFQGNLKIRGQAEFKLKSQFVGIPVEVVLLFGQRVAQDIQFFLHQVPVEVILQQFIDFIDQNSPAVLFFDQAHGNLTLPETGDVGIFPVILQDFIHFFLVVIPGDLHFQDRIQRVDLLFGNIHELCFKQDVQK